MNGETTSIGIWIIAFALLGTIVVLGGLFTIFWVLFRRASRPFQEMAAMPATPVAQVKDSGRTKIRGVVRFAEERLIDPLLGEPCAAYWVAVTKDRGDHGGNEHFKRRFVTIASETESVDFLIDDGTGIARVRGPVFLYSLDFDVPADSPRVARFLDAHGVEIPDEPIFPGGRAVREGATVIAVGGSRRAAGVPDGSGGPQDVIIEPSGRSPVAIADHDGVFVGKKEI